MKKFGITATIAAFLGLAAYTMAGAQPGQGFGGPWGRHFGGGPAARLLHGLDLDANQQEQLKAIREEARAARENQQRPPAVVQLQRQLQAEIFADSPDQARLTALQQQIVQAHAAQLARQVEVERKVAQVLTAEQRATVRERLAKAPERGARRGTAR